MSQAIVFTPRIIFIITPPPPALIFTIEYFADELMPRHQHCHYAAAPCRWAPLCCSLILLPLLKTLFYMPAWHGATCRCWAAGRLRWHYHWRQLCWEYWLLCHYWALCCQLVYADGLLRWGWGARLLIFLHFPLLAMPAATYITPTLYYFHYRHYDAAAAFHATLFITCFGFLLHWGRRHFLPGFGWCHFHDGRHYYCYDMMRPSFTIAACLMLGHATLYIRRADTIILSLGVGIIPIFHYAILFITMPWRCRYGKQAPVSFFERRYWWYCWELRRRWWHQR